jgi:hypothetical protein
MNRKARSSATDPGNLARNIAAAVPIATAPAASLAPLAAIFKAR